MVNKLKILINNLRSRNRDDFALISKTPEYIEAEKNYREWIKTNGLPLPSKRQLEWLDDEIGMFCHFGINTFHNMEWSDGTLPPSSFNPTNVDCNQWVNVAKKLGANYMIVTAKHHDGFCLWQTETTDYGIKSSPYKNGKGDIVKEFVEACKKANMKMGIYLSPWDRHEKCYKDEKAYDEFYCKQLTELLTNYDAEYYEIWLDGAGSAGHKYNWKKIMGVIKKYQPDALIFNMGAPTIRWVGNESGYANDPNWNVVQMTDYDNMDLEEIEGVGIEIKVNYGFGNVWMPAECDMPIRNHTWFYNTHNESKIYSLKHLVDMYDKSVGRGANLLLNLAPNREGLIDPADAKRAEELGNEIRKRYSNPIIEIINSSDALKFERISNDSKDYLENYILEWDFGKEISFNCVMTQEDIEKGQRIREYQIEYYDNGIGINEGTQNTINSDEQWKKFKHGWTIGHKKIDHFNNHRIITASRLRIRVMNSFGEPLLKRIALFLIEPIKESKWSPKVIWRKIPTIPRVK